MSLESQESYLTTGMLPYKQSRFFPQYGRLYNAARVFARLGSLAIMRTGNGFNKVIMYILPSKQVREILFEATRTCVWLKLDVCSMRVRFATEQRNTSGLINFFLHFLT